MLRVTKGNGMDFGSVGVQGVIQPVLCGSGGDGTMCSEEPDHKQPLGRKIQCSPLKP